MPVFRGLICLKITCILYSYFPINGFEEDPVNRRHAGKSWIAVLAVVVLCVLNTATIRKKDDPILNTQTNPIAYETKMEENKEGEKGAPMPAWRLYPRLRFLSDSPNKKNNPQAEELPPTHKVVIGDVEESYGIEDYETAAAMPVEESYPREELNDPWWPELVDENTFKETFRMTDTRLKPSASDSANSNS